MLTDSGFASGFSQKRVLITGGLGFIGSSTARRLVSLGAKVTIVDSLIPQYGGNFFNIHDIEDQVKVNITDVRDPFAMTYLVQGQDYLFNLAGQISHTDSMVDPKTDLEINALAQLSMLEACRHHNPDIKIVFASTRQIYGKPQYLPVDENHPIVPVDVNGINKQAGEQYHLLYDKVHGIRATALRLTNTYGPGMRIKDARQTFLGIWLHNLVRGLPIKVFGTGSQLRDFNFVEDVVDAMLISALSPEANGNVFNLGNNEYISLKALAELMIEIHGQGSYEIVPFPDDRKAIDIGDYYSNFEKVQKVLGWSPQVSLREGLAKTLKYYAQYGEHYWQS
jgi:UDP-glucose 4-epimerase